MNKTGLVLKVEKSTAILVTNTGEFVKVTCSANVPKIGETYTGILKTENNYIKYLAATVAFFIIFITGGGAYAYYTPVATIRVNINPSMDLKVNRFDKIIESTPINEDGEVLLKDLQLKNKSVNEALISIVNQAEKDNFINDNYIIKGKTISIKILDRRNNKNIDLNKFQRYIAGKKINTIINNNGRESKQEFIKSYKGVNKKVPINKNKGNSTSNKNSNKNTKNVKNKPNDVEKLNRKEYKKNTNKKNDSDTDHKSKEKDTSKVYSSSTNESKSDNKLKINKIDKETLKNKIK